MARTIRSPVQAIVNGIRYVSPVATQTSATGALSLVRVSALRWSAVLGCSTMPHLTTHPARPRGPGGQVHPPARGSRWARPRRDPGGHARAAIPVGVSVRLGRGRGGPCQSARAGVPVGTPTPRSRWACQPAWAGVVVGRVSPPAPGSRWARPRRDPGGRVSPLGPGSWWACRSARAGVVVGVSVRSGRGRGGHVHQAAAWGTVGGTGTGTGTGLRVVGQIWASEPAYILSICSAKLASTLRRLIFMDGVISPASMLRSRGRMANFLTVSQRFSLPLSSST